MRGNEVKTILFSTLLLAHFPCFSATKTFYTLSRAQDFQSYAKGDYFIQMGNFSQQLNAIEFERNIKKFVQFPVATHHSNHHFIVIVGPMHTDKEVREAGQQLSKTKKHAEPIFLVSPPPISFTDQIFPSNDAKTGSDVKMGAIEIPWFIGLGAGVQQLNIVNPIYVANGSSFTYPYNYDKFSTQTNAQAVVAAEIGYRWKNTSQWIPGQKWFPGYAISLYYNHLFSTNVGDQIEQYSTPAFTNYRYTWKVSADALLAIAKLNLIEYQQFIPFIQVGLGGSFNHATQYGETAYSNVTKRINPAFGDNTIGAFAYDLGAGVDWQFSPQFSLSLLYQFQNLDRVESRPGASTWRSDTLNSSSYQTNLALLKLDYYFSL